MKNYIKRILLACTLVLGLMLLSGCEQQEDSITALDPALEEGEYTLEVHVQPYDRETGAAKNDAVVSADLIVAS